MKYLHALCIFLMLGSISIIQAQQQYTVDGQTYTLKTEVNGDLSLLWNSINEEYRYFAKKGTTIAELKNTKGDDGYQEEFKDVLKLLTKDAAVSTEKLKLTLTSLRDYFISYNKKVDPNFSQEVTKLQLQTRLGVFAGMSNNAYFFNPNNDFLPSFGIDFEVMDEAQLRRHSVVFQFKQLLESSKYEFSSSQVSFNYRFKFIKSDKIDAFINAKAATFTSVSRNQVILDNNGEISDIYGSGTSFQVPGAFGIGIDYALGNGYITLAYHDIVALTIDNNGEAPVDITLGYKLNL
jgi:hypothetical protein